MLIVYVTLILFPFSSLAQFFDSFTGNDRDPVVIWSTYDSASSSAVFHASFFNYSETEDIRMTSLVDNATVPRAFYVTNLRGMAADYTNRRLIVADWLSGAVGQVFVHDRFETSYYQLLTGGRLGLIGGYSQFELEELQPQLRDLAFIEDVAVDWMTENIYYTRLNTINVIDSGFNFHIELFRNTRTRITALALHPIERTMFYATFGSLDFSSYSLFGGTSRVYTTDLSGDDDDLELFRSGPPLNEVTGMAIDFEASPSRLLSSDINGADLNTEVFVVPGAVFKQIAVFQGLVHIIGEVRGLQGQPSYMLWSILTGLGSDGRGTRSKMLSLNQMPMSITIMVDYLDHYNISAAYTDGSCAASEPCDRLCLPRRSIERRCRCGPGEVRATSNTCRVDNDGSDNNQDTGASSENDGGAGPILFVVLIPVIAVIIIVVWLVYRRRQQKKQKDLESPTNTNLIKKDGENSTNSEDKPKEGAAENEEQPEASKDAADEKPGTSKSEQQDDKTSPSPKSSQGDQNLSPSYRASRSSRGYYDERDPRYSRGYYVDDYRASRGYYGDQRASRGYYDDRGGYYRDGDRYVRDPRSSRGYYDSRDPRNYYGDRDPRYYSRPYPDEARSSKEQYQNSGNPPSRNSSRRSNDAQSSKISSKDVSAAAPKEPKTSTEIKEQNHTKPPVETDLPPPPSDPLGVGTPSKEVPPSYLETESAEVHQVVA